MSDTDKLYIGCPIQHARQFIAGKWQMGILWNLKTKPLRFGEIRELLPGIPDKTLMQELDFFVQKKVIERNKLELPSHRIEYTLSAMGKNLIPIVISIVEWGYVHLQDERVSKGMNITPLVAIQEIESSMDEPQ
jgi:DNA-binding HxlR family transcriptional regulator